MLSTDTPRGAAAVSRSEIRAEDVGVFPYQGQGSGATVDPSISFDNHFNSVTSKADISLFLSFKTRVKGP